MTRIILVGLGGMCGSMARYALSDWASRLGDLLPYGTLSVNLLGCFALGFLMTYSLEIYPLPPQGRIFLTTGFLGGFTTFSTFTYETMAMLREASWAAAGLNLGANVLGGLAALWLGVVCARLI